jgi:hypothetical protein
MVVHIYHNDDRTRYNYSHTEIQSVLKLFAASSRDFSKFHIHQNLLMDQAAGMLFWHRNAPNITHLTIRKSKFGSQALAKVLKMAQKLESLEFYDMGVGKMNKWQYEDFAELKGQLALRHLRWREELIIEEKLFKLLTGLLKPGTLQSLALGDYDVDDAAGTIKSQMIGTAGLGGAEKLLRMDTFADFLRANQANLRNLEIVDTIQETAMKPLVLTKLPDLKLERLALRYFMNFCRSQDLTNFFKRLQPGLKELLLFGVTADNETMQAIVASQKDVEVFQNIQRTSQRMDAVAISLLHNFKNLKVWVLNSKWKLFVHFL